MNHVRFHGAMKPQHFAKRVGHRPRDIDQIVGIIALCVGVPVVVMLAVGWLL